MPSNTLDPAKEKPDIQRRWAGSDGEEHVSPQWFMVRVSRPGEEGTPESYHLSDLKRCFPSVAAVISEHESESADGSPSFTGCTLVWERLAGEEEGEEGIGCIV